MVITPTIKYSLDIIKTAATIPTIKRFVYTSSSSAATFPYPDKEFTTEHDSWNEPAVKQAWAPAPYEPSRAYAVYAASKTQVEQVLWKFVKEEKPGFVLNTGISVVKHRFVEPSNHDQFCPILLSAQRCRRKTKETPRQLDGQSTSRKQLANNLRAW